MGRLHAGCAMEHAVTLRRVAGREWPAQLAQGSEMSTRAPVCVLRGVGVGVVGWCV